MRIEYHKIKSHENKAAEEHNTAGIVMKTETMACKTRQDEASTWVW